MITENFAALILTNGRPDRVHTYSTLRKFGYTGRIVIVVDDMDETRSEYLRRYGDEVFVFNKQDAANETDSGDNFGGLRGVVFARNAAFKVAESLGIEYFVALDDDYREFKYRFSGQKHYRPKQVKNLDGVFSAVLKFFIKSGCTSISLAQGGDFIGGAENQNAKTLRLSRKCMNSFFCSVKRPFKFMGRINEDVNAYVSLAPTGSIFFTTYQVCLEQLQTQSNPGGLTEIYLDLGTYLKSFYSVMYQPSSVKVRALRDRLQARLHHSVKWRYTTPKIISEQFRRLT